MSRIDEDVPLSVLEERRRERLLRIRDAHNAEMKNRAGRYTTTMTSRRRRWFFLRSPCM